MSKFLYLYQHLITATHIRNIVIDLMCLLQFCSSIIIHELGNEGLIFIEEIRQEGNVSPGYINLL